MAKETFGYLVAFAAAIGGLLFGYEIGVVSQTLSMTSFGLQFDLVTFVPNMPLPDGSLALNGSVIMDLKPFQESNCLKFNATFSTCETESAAGTTGLVTFTFLIGCALGAMIVSILADLWGRKKCIILSGIFFLIGGAFQSLSTSSIVFFTGRWLSGIAVGVLSMVVPLYISESAPTSIRGRMIAIQQLMVTIGIVIASIINTIIILMIGRKDPLNGLEWRLALAMQCIPAFLLSAIMIFMPESPRWLAEKGREGEALKTIAKLRSSNENDADIQEEFGDIMEGVNFERTIGTGTW
jgi:MFS transporter, SP family, sugar:H+ symporter